MGSTSIVMEEGTEQAEWPVHWTEGRLCVSCSLLGWDAMKNLGVWAYLSLPEKKWCPEEPSAVSHTSIRGHSSPWAGQAWGCVTC